MWAFRAAPCSGCMGETIRVGDISRQSHSLRKQHAASEVRPSCNRAIAKERRGETAASTANGTDREEAVLDLADRKASSSMAGPSHSTSNAALPKPIQQYSLPDGNPNLATLVCRCIAGAWHCTVSVASLRQCLSRLPVREAENKAIDLCD